MSNEHTNRAFSSMKLCQRFERYIDLLIEAHESLLNNMEDKHKAMRSADLNGLQCCMNDEQECIRRIGELEEKRKEITTEIVPLGNSGHVEQVTIQDMIHRLPESQSESIQQKADHLRNMVIRIRERGSIVRSTGEALSEHLAGLVQRFRSLTSATGLYTNHGRIGPAPRLDVCTLDVSQ